MVWSAGLASEACRSAAKRRYHIVERPKPTIFQNFNDFH
jgi:hypothetical protein